MRHLAWLHATPKKAKRSRQDQLKALSLDHPHLELPDIYPCGHIVEYLFEAGPGTGEHSLSWGEIRAWRREVGIELSEFEVVMIAELSRVYLGQRHDAADPLTPPPYQPERAMTADRRASVAGGLRAALAKAAPSDNKRKPKK